MLVARIEIWPHGDEAAKRELGFVLVGNDATGDRTLGNYDIKLLKGERAEHGERPWRSEATTTATGRVCSYERSRGPFELICLAIASAIFPGDTL